MTEYHDENFWWGIKLRSVKECHGDAKCLTRIKLDTHMVATTFLVILLLLAILAYRQLFVPGSDLWLWILYVVGFGILATRSYRLKRRVAELVDATAQRCGFARMGRNLSDKAFEEPAAPTTHFGNPAEPL